MIFNAFPGFIPDIKWHEYPAKSTPINKVIDLFPEGWYNIFYFSVIIMGFVCSRISPFRGKDEHLDEDGISEWMAGIERLRCEGKILNRRLDEPFDEKFG